MKRIQNNIIFSSSDQLFVSFQDQSFCKRRFPLLRTPTQICKIKNQVLGFFPPNIKFLLVVSEQGYDDQLSLSLFALSTFSIFTLKPKSVTIVVQNRNNIIYVQLRATHKQMNNSICNHYKKIRVISSKSSWSPLRESAPCPRSTGWARTQCWPAGWPSTTPSPKVRLSYLATYRSYYLV